MKRTSGNRKQQPESEICQLEKKCRQLISNSTSLFNTVNFLMQRHFTEEEIISHSVSCKVSNLKTVAKLKFNLSELELLRSLVMDLHKEITSSQIRCKIQAIQSQLIKPSLSCSYQAKSCISKEWIRRMPQH